MRFRVTVRGDGIELRGYIDGETQLTDLAKDMEPFGIVVASPANEDYNPFVLQPPHERSQHDLHDESGQT